MRGFGGLHSAAPIPSAWKLPWGSQLAPGPQGGGGRAILVSSSLQMKRKSNWGLHIFSTAQTMADHPSPLLLLILCVPPLPPELITPAHHTGQLTQLVPAVAFTGTRSFF